MRHRKQSPSRWSAGMLGAALAAGALGAGAAGRMTTTAARPGSAIPAAPGSAEALPLDTPAPLLYSAPLPGDGRARSFLTLPGLVDPLGLPLDGRPTPDGGRIDAHEGAAANGHVGGDPAAAAQAALRAAIAGTLSLGDPVPSFAPLAGRDDGATPDPLPGSGSPEPPPTAGPDPAAPPSLPDPRSTLA